MIWALEPLILAVVIIYRQPKQCTIIKEIPQSYHTFAASLIPKKMSPIEGPGNDSGKAMRPCHPPTFPWIPMYLGLRLNVKSISLGPGHLVCLLRWVVKVLNHHSVSHGLQLQFKFSHFMKGKWPSKPLSSHLRCRQTSKASMIPKCSPFIQLSHSPFYLNRNLRIHPICFICKKMGCLHLWFEHPSNSPIQPTKVFHLTSGRSLLSGV